MASKTVYCTVCDISVKSKAFSAHLRSNIHKNNSSIEISDGIEKISSAFRSRIASYRVRAPATADSGDDTNDVSLCPPAEFLSQVRSRVHNLLAARQATYSSIKVNFEFFAEFKLPKTSTSEIKSFAFGQNVVLHHNYDFNDLFSKIVSSIVTSIDEFEEKDSGWSFVRNLYLEVNVNKYNPLRAARFIDLPRNLKLKHACINIQNNDSFCFLWCIVAALFPAKNNAHRTSSYPHFENVLNIQNMMHPVGFSDIRIFEKNNHQISVNVYGLANKSNIVGPLYKTQSKRKHHVNLLLLEKGEFKHYCLIKNLSRLLRPQLTKHHGKIYFCDDCMIFFNSEQNLNTHICSGVRTVLPDPGTVIQFKHFERMQDMPFVIYADFESLLVPQSSSDGLVSNNTCVLQKHLPAAFAYYVVCSYDSSQNKYVSYRGQDCVEKFLEYLGEDITNIHKILKEPIPMTSLTSYEQKSFDDSKYCFLCDQLLFDDKVRDHCHLTGKYRGAAHSYCNLQYCVPKFIPVFFHNLSGYDSHLFIRQLGATPGNIKVIAKNKENYISFTKFFSVGREEYMPVRFVDSFKFLGTSLEKLAGNLNKNDFFHLPHFFHKTEHFDLLRRKGVYPYEYMTNWKCFEEDRLPPRKCFYSSLTDEIVSESDYCHAQCVWKTFNLKNLGEYTDLYLKTDVILLADVFENFRRTCKINYKLDPAFYMTAPGLSFDAMLLKTKVKLELIENLEILRMIQKGIRGGVCLCSTRYAKANNKYISNYDPYMPDNYLLYIDCNNLYGYAMCSYLPYSNFELISQTEISELNVLHIPNDSEFGYILEVDLEYPENLHDLHNDLPFCAQKFTPPNSKNSKLIPNLYDKFYYVIHYVHLKTCLKHGLLLKKIHRVIKFKQSPFLKQYIDLNTELRQKAKSTFEQDFFKLLNNSIFGKTLEDTEKRLSVHLVNQWNDIRNKTKKCYTAEQLISRPNFHSCTVFTENFVAVQMKPESVILDKPIYIGFTVLEISKNHMYDFHYSITKPFYGSNLKLCYTDTDSLLYSIEATDIYEDIRSNFQQYFDTSNYTENNQFNIVPRNKKVPGLFKDEMGGQLIVEFVGLRSKLYCVKTQDQEIKKAKGIKKSVVKKIDFKDYNKVLLLNKALRKTNVLFKSLKHEIFTQAVSKVALSSHDDKRIILKDKISTLSWGHKSSLF